MLLTSLAPHAWAKGSGDAPSIPTDTVSYASIDASTLRVFALGTVGVETVQGPGFNVEVAAPHAGHGTGFAVAPELIVTAQHVVAGARHVVVRLPGEGGFLPARVVYSNEEEDIAVLHVNAALTPIRMATDTTPLRVRQTVFAVGYPLDPSRTQAQSAKGIISGHLKDNSLQLGISVNPGNSGGPLVDEQDTVVGMVVARGDVEEGVQGIGVAVPIGKILLAITQARVTLDAGQVPPLTVHDTMSAEVVDELIQQGTLHSVRDASDLKKSFADFGIEGEIERLASRLNDADLLLFVAGNLWNASLVIRYGGVREIGDRTLNEAEAQSLSNDLRVAAIRLTRRAGELDTSISARSNFVRVALSSNTSQVEGGVYGGYQAPIATESRWTLHSYPHLRRNESAEGGWGFGLELKQQIIGLDRHESRFFGSWGISLGRVSLDTPDVQSLTHSYYAFELGLGLSVPIGDVTSLEFYGGIAPSYYSASVESTSGMTTTEGGMVLDHLRATVSVARGRWYLSSGMRFISSALWLEPIGLGINF